MDNLGFLNILTNSFKKFLTTGSRSNEKLKILHGAIATDLQQRIGIEYGVHSLGYGDGREETIGGRYIEKKADITISYRNSNIAGIAVKFVMQNYSQNSNNYFENMLGETANIRSKRIPYFQIFIIPDKMPYYDNKGNLRKWETFTLHNARKYFILSKDDINVNAHTPNKTLLFVVHLPDLQDCIRNKAEYVNAYLQMNDMKINLSNCDYGVFDSSVVLNEREFGIRKPLEKLWEWNVFSTFKGENQQVT